MRHLLKTYLTILVALLLPTLAHAVDAAWSSAATDGGANTRSVKAVCSAGTCAAPTTAAHGMDLTNVGTYKVSIVAPTAATVAGGKLKFYWYSPAAAKWIPDATRDITVPAAASAAGGGYTFDGDSPGLGFPVLLPKGRVAYVMDQVTAASGGTVYIEATSLSGQSL